MLERKAVGVPYNGVMSENAAADAHPTSVRTPDGHGPVGKAPTVGSRTADPSPTDPAAADSGAVPGVGASQTSVSEIQTDANRPTALIVDWGGVLTSPLEAALDDWYAAEGIPADAFAGAMRDFHDGALAALSPSERAPVLFRIRPRVDRHARGSAPVRARGSVADPNMQSASIASECAAPLHRSSTREPGRSRTSPQDHTARLEFRNIKIRVIEAQ